MLRERSPDIMIGRKRNNLSFTSRKFIKYHEWDFFFLVFERVYKKRIKKSLAAGVTLFLTLIISYTIKPASMEISLVKSLTSYNFTFQKNDQNKTFITRVVFCIHVNHSHSISPIHRILFLTPTTSQQNLLQLLLKLLLSMTLKLIKKKTPIQQRCHNKSCHIWALFPLSSLFFIYMFKKKLFETIFYFYTYHRIIPHESNIRLKKKITDLISFSLNQKFFVLVIRLAYGLEKKVVFF